MNYCSNCGAGVVVRIPDGEHLPRHVCPVCGTVHYENPKLVVGCVPVDEQGRILVCKRAIEPRYGFWTLPAGFMENNETLQQAAAREAYEEALADAGVRANVVSMPSWDRFEAADAGHRAAVLRGTDWLVHLARGRVVEAGTHAQLLAARGAYFMLAEEEPGA